ncbi:hypothetical protein D8674_021763 [Pyrus ussuriensis x Pyrus communis]|uniref:Uncharacterized protein n=1 Tax=Pyrus ussuriensis x Pyrus communis TaxID=2448454 RepID=A0A5N5GI12_9ROSA|nr:hypothetical protein D8674_021763 [Pyrus ussuriensis x Pyrus communis]
MFVLPVLCDKAFFRCIMPVESPKCLTTVDESFTTANRLQREATEGVQAPNGVLPELTAFPEKVTKDSNVQPLKAVPSPEIISLEEVNLIEELIPSGEAFSSWVDFRRIKVYLRLARMLSRFFERYTSSLELTKHRLLYWSDMISNMAALGVPMGSLVEKLGELHDTMFRLQLEKEKGALRHRLAFLGEIANLTALHFLSFDMLHEYKYSFEKTLFA